MKLHTFADFTTVSEPDIYFGTNSIVSLIFVTAWRQEKKEEEKELKKKIIIDMHVTTCSSDQYELSS